MPGKGTAVSLEERVARIDRMMPRYPDFPKPGINFVDIFPVMQNPEVFADLVSLMVEHIQGHSPGVEIVVGLEARGFILGPLIAQRLGVGFVPVRKAGKLPGDTVKASYILEYGGDTFEIQKGSVKQGQKVVIVDDLLATGGTMAAACKLMKEVEAEVLSCIVIIELTELQGRAKVPKDVHAIVKCQS